MATFVENKSWRLVKDVLRDTGLDSVLSVETVRGVDNSIAYRSVSDTGRVLTEEQGEVYNLLCWMVDRNIAFDMNVLRRAYAGKSAGHSIGFLLSHLMSTREE